MTDEIQFLFLCTPDNTLQLFSITYWINGDENVIYSPKNLVQTRILMPLRNAFSENVDINLTSGCL